MYQSQTQSQSTCRSRQPVILCGFKCPLLSSNQPTAETAPYSCLLYNVEHRLESVGGKLACLVELGNSSSRQVAQSRMIPRRVVSLPIARMVQTTSFIKISTFIFLSLVLSCSSRRSPYHVRSYYKPSYQPAKLTPALAKSSSCSSNPFLSTCSSLTLNPRWIYSDLGGGVLLPEDSIPARGRREKLFRRYHYLQYIRLVFQKL